jgi:flagellar hook protein FlgE
MGFSTSLSGLSAQQTKLSVIGNNLANINTIGFKASTVNFSDLVSQSVGGASANPMQIGLGVTTGSITPNFSQGGMAATGVPTNVAIQGNGFFLIGDAENRAYTRAGDFSFDSKGMLVTSDGQPVQGYTATDPLTGKIIASGQPGSVIVPPGVLRTPIETTQFQMLSNLDVNAPVGGKFIDSVQIYDSLGASHIATVTYTNTAPGAWNYDLTVPGEDVSGGVVGDPPVSLLAAPPGSLTFDSAGKLDTVDGNAAPAADVTLTAPNWANGANPGTINWDLVDANGVGAITGYQATSQTSSKTQNGAAAGTVNDVSINAAGEIIATFGAGKTISVGMLAMANFNNPTGLVKLGGNAYGESAAAGTANVGVAGTGGRGSLIGSNLEQSNVDIAQEFTQMILAQRGYQANAKSITTIDEVLVETLNLKR